MGFVWPFVLHGLDCFRRIGDAAALLLLLLAALGLVRARGCVSSHSVRAAANGSMPDFCHQVASSLQRCTSRWWVRHSGTVNSSLAFRPRARSWAKRKWWGS